MVSSWSAQHCERARARTRKSKLAKLPFIRGRHKGDRDHDDLADFHPESGGSRQASGESNDPLTAIKDKPFHGVRFDGRTYDTGSKLGFLAANVAFALDRPELADGFKAELKKIVGSL